MMKFQCRILPFILFVILSLCFFAWADEPLDPVNRQDWLTQEERAWLKDHPVIRLAPDPHYPPIEYFDEVGVYRGITADYVALAEEMLGIRFEIVRLDNWKAVIDAAKSRTIDVIGAAVPTPERSDYLFFSRIYLVIPAVIVVRDEVRQSLTLDQLSGMRVLIVAGTALDEYVRSRNPDVQIDAVPNVQTGLRKLSFGMADAMAVDIATATYFIQREGITNLRISSELNDFTKLAFGLRNDWPELRTIFDKVLDRIPPKKNQQIYDKWINLKRDSQYMRKEFWYILIASTGLALLLVVGVLTWNRSLKKQVSRKTAALAHELAERKTAETALQESEQRFRNIFENAVVGLYRTTPAGGILMANPMLIHLLGFDSFDDLAERDLEEEGYEPAYPRNEFKNQMERFGEVHGLESAWKRKDGTTIFLRESARAVRDDDGKILYYEGTVEDITERKRAEEAVSNSLKEKELLLKEIHHRVKNNLQIISSLLNMQSRHITDPDALAMFQDSRNRIRSMALVHEKLYRSSDLAHIDFHAYIKTLAHDLFQMHRVHPGDISFIVKVDNIYLNVDLAVPVGLIITELLTNALKHAFSADWKDEKRIAISLSKSQKGEISLVVSDNGVGLPEEIDPQKSQSLGLQLVSIIGEGQLEGDIHVDRSHGTEYRIAFKA